MNGNTITTTTVILVFAVLIVISLMAAWLCNPSTFDNTNWKVFIVTLSSLSIVMTVMFYYAVVELQISQQQLTSAQELRSISGLTLHILQTSMMKYMAIIPRFVLSLHPLQKHKKRKYNSRSSSDDNCNEKVVAKNGISYEIFNLWQSTIADIKFSHACDYGYISLYLQWATSRRLKKQWDTQCINFSQKTREFGDLLFERASMIYTYSVCAFNSVAEELINSETLRAILD